jgi:LDH2 family malate/lactate/ureidoglycolate dehydrogenase
MKGSEIAAWATLIGALIGGVFLAEDRYANAGETATTMLQQKLLLRNDQERLANDNRLERMERELLSIHARRQSGALYPGDGALITNLQDEIRIAREYRSVLRTQAAQIK